MFKCSRTIRVGSIFLLDLGQDGFFSAVTFFRDVWNNETMVLENDNVLSSDAVLVSVVVPVFNAETYLGECMDSLIAQDYKCIEIICVDDGSTDSTLQICAEFARQDDRVVVVTQKNSGPGIARNAGMDIARGDYLYFADSDEIYCENLISTCLDHALSTDSDIVVFPFFQLNQKVGIPVLAQWAVLSENYPSGVFSWRDNPAYLFRSFQNFPWNKFYKTAFVQENNIRFEEIYLTEDLMFSAPALVLAQRIICLEEPLMYHREGLSSNSMSKKNEHPFDFLVAFESLKSFLEEKGLYEDLEEAYANWALESCVYNLLTINSLESFRMLYEKLQQESLWHLGLLTVERGRYHQEDFLTFLDDVVTKDADEFLFSHFVDFRDDAEELSYRSGVSLGVVADLRKNIKECQEDIALKEREILFCSAQRDDLQRRLDETMNAAEQKVGSVICALPRAIQRQMLKHRSNR